MPACFSGLGEEPGNCSLSLVKVALSRHPCPTNPSDPSLLLPLGWVRRSSLHLQQPRTPRSSTGTNTQPGQTGTLASTGSLQLTPANCFKFTVSYPLGKGDPRGGFSPFLCQSQTDNRYLPALGFHFALPSGVWPPPHSASPPGSSMSPDPHPAICLP